MRQKFFQYFFLVLAFILALLHLTVFQNDNTVATFIAFALIATLLLGYVLEVILGFFSRQFKTIEQQNILIDAVTQSQLSLFLIDQQNLIRAFSPNFEKIFQPQQSVLNQSLLTLFPQIAYEQLSQARNILTYQTTFIFDVIQLENLSTMKVFEMALYSFKSDHEGWLVGVIHDKSQRYQEEKRLIQAKEKLDQFLENIPGGVFIKDANGQLIYQNQQSIFECMEYPRLQQYITSSTLSSQSRPGIPSTLQAEHQKFSEEVREWEIWQFPLYTSWDEFTAGITFDITNRRQQDKRLIESQAFLEATLNNNPAGLIILDAKTTNIRVANQEFKRLLGISPHENLLGRTINFDHSEWQIYQMDGEPFPIDQNPIYQAFFNEQAWTGRIMLRHNSGQTRFALVNSAPIYDVKQQFLAVVVVFMDITDLVVTELKLQELNRELEQRVEMRTQDLKKANLELQHKIDELKETQRQLIETEKLAGLGNLVAGVAHEINTPIGVGVTASSFLEDLIKPITTKLTEGTLTRAELNEFLEKTRQSSHIILTNLQRASQLIQSFKLISVDQSTDSLRQFKVKEYFEDIFRSLHPPTKRIHLTIEVTGDEELWIQSYPGAFSQILTNLYMNSCIHGFEDREKGRIRTHFFLDKQYLIVTYEDDGKGMDNATQQKIFEPFFSTKRNKGGTGLGMHIVYNLVTQKLGGSIGVWSEPNQGARFTLKLPLPSPTGAIENNSPEP